MLLFDRNSASNSIYVARQEDEAVQLAAHNLAADIEAVCGVRPAVTETPDDRTKLMIGTWGRCPLLSALPPAELMSADGSLRAEGYCQSVHDEKLWLNGCDRRGTIYAIYAFSEAIGVSPWYDMADVPVKQKDRIQVEDHLHIVDWPCVRWRGIFLNDEEELESWARKHTGDDTIGPETYRRIFELILRLGGNMIWPAMHVNAFNANPENGKLAHRMGIVTGTSHCDMLHRSNQNEWLPWIAKKGYLDQKYDFSIPGKNRERLLEYWRESLEQNRSYDAVYTIGMRGIHDSGLEASCMKDDVDPTVQQRKLLEEIIAVQRKMLREIVGENVPQAFVPYKEVLPVYDSGLQIPEDVTLVWVDDNHGHMRRYPNAAEQQRAGGNGLYYHSSYWAPPGMSWLFLCSIPLSHMGNELKKCWEQWIRTLWIDNVGALKPIEMDMEYFLRYAWNAGRAESLVHDSVKWMASWIDRQFSGEIGARTAELYSRWAQLSNLCKPEHMRSRVFSQTAYGDEAAARLKQMKEISDEISEIWKHLPAAEQDAFFQLVAMKMKASTYIAASYYYADRSLNAGESGAWGAAEFNAVRSREMDDLKRLLLYYYNKSMAKGKWDRILTPENFPPPPLELYPACRPALRLTQGTLAISRRGWMQEGQLTFEKGGIREKYFDLQNTGCGEIPVRIEADAGIRLSAHELVVGGEARIGVAVRDDFQKGSVRIFGQKKMLVIPVCQTDAAADGYVHFRAEHAEAQDGFRRVAHMGRGQGDVMEALPDLAQGEPAFLRLSFDLKTDCAPCLEVIRFLTLNSTGTIEMEVVVDRHMSFPLHSFTVDEWTGSWESAVLRNGEKLYVELPRLEKGRHQLEIRTLTPYLTLYAFNLYLASRADSVLGPGECDPCPPLPVFDVKNEETLYMLLCQDVPLPDMIYADPGFWKQNMLYGRVKQLPQAATGQKLDVWQYGRKDIYACINPGLPTERDGYLAWDTMKALLNQENAWQTAGDEETVWLHRQGECYGRTGIAMCTPWKEDPAPYENGPRLHYRFRCSQNGPWRLWLLCKYDDAHHFRLRLYLDSRPLQEHASVCRESFHTYRTVYVWAWHELAEFSMNPGDHELSLEGNTAGLAVERIYLTTGEELPPVDQHWCPTDGMEPVTFTC